MIYDVLLFLELLAVVYVAFTIAFFGVGRAGFHTYVEDFGSYDGPLTITTWAMYGWLDPARYTSTLGVVLVFVYVLFVHVALINLLIAMFADTYGRVKRNAEKEFSYKKYHSVYLHQRILLRVPPPLSIPIILIDFLASQAPVARLRGMSSSDLTPEQLLHSMTLDDSIGENNGEQLVMGSLRRQATTDACTMNAIASTLPAEFSKLEHTMTTELLSLRHEMAKLAVQREGAGDGTAQRRASEFAHNEWASMSRLGSHLNPQAAREGLSNPLSC